MLRTTLLISAATAILVAACSASGGAGSSGVPVPSLATGAASTSSAAPGAGTNALPPDITDPIVADAATRLGVDPTTVAIVDARAETWPDGSLGCPEPGMGYTQALVDGYRVIVEANGTQLDYRGGAPGQFQLCENP